MSLSRTRSNYTPHYEFLTRIPNFGWTHKPLSLLAHRSSKNPSVARPARRTSLPPCPAPSSSSSSPSSLRLPSSAPSCLGWMFVNCLDEKLCDGFLLPWNFLGLPCLNGIGDRREAIPYVPAMPNHDITMNVLYRVGLILNFNILEEEHKRKWPVLRTQGKTSNKRLKTLEARRRYNS
ncbi:hypothetical protein DVH24_033325 [Malus domestica]|uniref:Uncharacterized protein n=1 Tax=Malus domestica TaxID=3750 RepID=A0A498J9H1_MALDO|nr:hypothetical protein DVH24_033325 [Malus domestica]